MFEPGDCKSSETYLPEVDEVAAKQATKNGIKLLWLVRVDRYWSLFLVSVCPLALQCCHSSFSKIFFFKQLGFHQEKKIQ